MNRALIALTLAMIAAPLAAKEKAPVFVQTQAVKDKPAVALDPAKAYVLLRSVVPTPLYLIKVPTTQDQAAYDALRAAAFVEAREKYARNLVYYQDDMKAAAKRPRQPNSVKPEKPIEPTAENFEFTPLALLAGVSIGPINRFAKDGFSTYLQEVTPGTYRIYGLLAVLPGVAPSGFCYCMGSVKFDAKPGEIVDLGAIPQTAAVDRPAGDSSYPGDHTAATVFVDAAADMPLDPRLASYKTVRADFRPVGKLPNYFGLTVSRVPAMIGVMRYDRDRIVDLTATR